MPSASPWEPALAPTGPAQPRGQGWTRLLPTIIIGLIALMGVVSVAETVFDHGEGARAAVYDAELDDARQLHSLLDDAGLGLRDYVLSGRAETLAPYLAASRELAAHGPLLARLDAFAAAGPADEASFSAMVAALQAGWATILQLVRDGRTAEAAAALTSTGTAGLAERLHGHVVAYVKARTAAQAGEEAWSGVQHAILRVVTLGGALTAIVAMLYAFGSITRAIAAGFAAKEQVEKLFSMADMLQSAAGQDDTNEVLCATATNLLPGFGGALYVFNNSRDRLDLSTRWGPGAESSVDHLMPAACWALKRGKPHLNGPGAGALRCNHVADGQVALELPMAARGQLYGLLQIVAGGSDAAARLSTIQPVASAMADAMSLALSSIALRERLRNQALRDPLTGLYNRRFLEEMLERMCLEVERRRGVVAAIMIDLDHFKKLNDQHGHGAGDAVLRDVAAAILSCLRGVDVACRYGGEEIALLLPDCTLAMAVGKAEQIRSRIAQLTGPVGVSVTASLGVASIPETSAKAADLLATADAALYQAKQQGRDRVVAAPERPSAQRLALIEPEPRSAPAE